MNRKTASRVVHHAPPARMTSSLTTAPFVALHPDFAQRKNVLMAGSPPSRPAGSNARNSFGRLGEADGFFGLNVNHCNRSLVG